MRTLLDIKNTMGTLQYNKSNENITGYNKYNYKYMNEVKIFKPSSNRFPTHRTSNNTKPQQYKIFQWSIVIYTDSPRTIEKNLIRFSKTAFEQCIKGHMDAFPLSHLRITKLEKEKRKKNGRALS